MEKEQITFEDIPSFLVVMMDKLEEMTEKIDRLEQFKQNSKKDVWFSVKTLSEYIPSHPAVQTIYGWTHSRIIPFHKKGKSLLFLKSEVDKWLDAGKAPSESQMKDDAFAFVQRKNDESVRRKYFG